MTSTYEPSKKLENYLTKIQNETGREIVIQRSDDLGLSGMLSAFSYDPSHIFVQFVSSIDMTDPRVEHLIAHEATHGFLTLKKGYCSYFLKRPASGIEKRHVRILFTMVDDIVVNKTIQEESFPPFSSVYLSMVRMETKSILRGEDIYNQFSDDPLFKDRFMVFRYVMAWGFLKYFDLKSHDRRTIKKFTKAFENRCPKQSEMASQVRKTILENDIFTAEGRNNCMKELLKLWGLEDLAELKTNKGP